MAQESCNLDKDEAELLKPSPASSPSPATTSSPPPPPPALLKPGEEPLSETPLLLPPLVAEAATTLPACEPQPLPPKTQPASPAANPGTLLVAFSNRCSICRKRTGLAGFRCRCGELFCGRHRHSESHDCSFDYKTSGREEIARANPVIRAAKIMKI